MSSFEVKAGVAGRPIEHSLSPVLHEAAFAALGLPWLSQRFDIGLGEGQKLLETIQELHLVGVSVTMPLKSELLDLLDWVDASAWALQSVNCVVSDHGELTGYSTDGEGFVNWIGYEDAIAIAGSHAVVIGAGGAARAVARALCDAGAATVGIVARKHEAAGEAAQMAGENAEVASYSSLAKASLVINATPQGMAGTPHFDCLPCDPTLLTGDAVAVDLVYNPLETAWVQALRQRGIRTFGGLGMLVHQAAIQIELWTGAEAPIPEMLKAAQMAVLAQP